MMERRIRRGEWSGGGRWSGNGWAGFHQRAAGEDPVGNPTRFYAATAAGHHLHAGKESAAAFECGPTGCLSEFAKSSVELDAARKRFERGTESTLSLFCFWALRSALTSCAPAR